MVVNGRTQFVGSDRNGLREALAAEFSRKQIQLRIRDVKVTGANISFQYSAEGVSSSKPLQIMAALVDNSDKSSVLRGENSGRSLQHVSVARALAQVDTLQENGDKTVTLPLPPSFTQGRQPHHLIVFAQEQGLGSIVGVDAKAL
jgi:hypothetical protein